MADAVSWVGSILTISVATIGTTEITLGLMVALGLIFGFGFRAVSKLRRGA